MGIVAIGALDQALVDTMVEGHFKLGLLLQMARVTKFRLCFHQQKLFGLRMVRRMAGNATDIVLRVDGVDGVHMLRAAGVAAHAAGIDFLRRNVLEGEYLAYVASASHVVRTGPVTALASLPGWATLFIQCGLPVRRLFPTGVNVAVAALAGVRSHVLCNFGERGRRWSRGLSALFGALLARLARRGDDEKR